MSIAEVPINLGTLLGIIISAIMIWMFVRFLNEASSKIRAEESKKEKRLKRHEGGLHRRT